jgi:hypothetical protein
VQVLVTRTSEHADLLAHFCLGLHIVTADRVKATEISYSDVRSFLFAGVSYCDNRERVFMLDYNTNEKEHQTLGNLRPLVQIR